MFSYFSVSDIHISLKAEKLFSIGPVSVTNSMLYGLLCAIFICVVMRLAARNIKVRPGKGFSAIVEIMVDYIANLLTGPFGSRQKALRFVPIFGVYFVFIMFNNLLGLLPVVGPGIQYNGVPIFRPFTADINGTIAMAVIAVLMVQYLSIREQGGLKHLQHYFTNKPLNPINFFIGILEVMGEFTRIMSLSLRLFLNTAVGEILIAVFTSMILANGRTPIAVIPIFLFEGLVAYIQAFVFTVLAGTYLGMAISHSDHSDDHHPVKPKQVEAKGMSGG